jgi:O-antigen ligase
LPGRVLEKIAEVILSFLIVVTPLAFGSVYPWAYKVITASAFLLLALWLFKALKDGGFDYVRTPLNYFIPLFVILVLYQLLPLPVPLLYTIAPGREALRDAAGLSGGFDTVALYPWAAKEYGLLLVAVMAIFFLTINIFRSRERVNRILMFSLAAALIVMVFAVYQRAAVNRYSFLPFVNKNHFAGYMELMIPMAVASIYHNAMKAMRGRPKDLKNFIFEFSSGVTGAKAVFFICAALMLCFSVIMTGSRGGMLGMAFAVLALVCLLIKNKKAGIRIILAVVAVFAVVVINADDGRIGERVGTLADLSADNSAILRQDIWRDTFKIIEGSPVIGVGLGSFETAYPFYKTIKRDVHIFQPEDDYLYMLAEGGIIGLGLVVAFVLVYLKSAFRLLGKRSSFVRGVAAGCISGIGALMLHGLVETNLHIPAILLLAVIFMALTYSVAITSRESGGGMAEGRIEIPSRTGRVALRMGVALSLVVALASVAGAVSDLTYLAAAKERSESIKRAAVTPELFDGLAAKLDAASIMDPGRSECLFEEGRVYVWLGSFYGAKEAMGEKSGRTSRDCLEKALGCFRQSGDCNPYSSFAHLFEGGALESLPGQGVPAGPDMARAGDEFMKAVALNPTSPLIKARAATFFRKAGKPGVADAFEKELPSLDPSYNVINLKSFADDCSGLAFVGTRVKWTADAAVPVGKLEYKFSKRKLGYGSVEADLTDYGPKNEVVLDTAALEPGSYYIYVRVRGADGQTVPRVYYSGPFILEQRPQEPEVNPQQSVREGEIDPLPGGEENSGEGSNKVDIVN